MDVIKPDKYITDSPIDQNNPIAADQGSKKSNPSLDMIKESANSQADTSHKGESIAEDQHQEQTSGVSATIHEGSQGDSTHLLDHIHDNQHLNQSNGANETIAKGSIAEEGLGELAKIHDSESISDGIHATETIKEGTVGPTEHELDKIADGIIGNTEHATETIKDGTKVEDTAHQTESIAEGTSVSDTSHKLDTIHDGQSEQPDHVLDVIHEGEASSNRVHDLDVVKDNQHINAEQTPNVQDVKPDAGEEDDSPIDKVEVIHDGSVGDSTHQLDVIADGTKVDGVHELDTIAEGTVGNTEHKLDEIHEGTQQESEHLLDVIKDGTSNEGVHQTETIHEGTSNPSEHPLDVIKDGTKSDAEHSLETIKDGTSSEAEHPLDTIHEGTSSEGTHELDTIKDGTASEAIHELDTIKDGTKEDGVHDLEVIKDGTIGDTEHKLEEIHEGSSSEANHELDVIHEGTQGSTEHQLETIADGEPESQEHQLETIAEGSQNPTDHSLELMATNLHGVVPEDMYAAMDLINPAGSIDVVSDAGNEDDSPIDAVLPIFDIDQVHNTEHATEMIADGTQGPTEHETEQIKEGTSGPTEHSTEMIAEGDVTPGEHSLETIHEGTSGDTTHETETIAEGDVTPGDHALETIVGEDVTPNEHELETILTGDPEAQEHELEIIHDGDPEKSEHELETIHDGDVEAPEHELENIAEGTSVDPVHETEMIAEGTSEDPDHALENISSAENGVPEHEGIHEDESIAQGDNNINPDEQPYETLTITDETPIYESEVLNRQGETLDVNPDQGGEDDSPIDKVLPINDVDQEHDTTHELDQVSEDTHEEQTEHQLDEVKEGTQGDTEHVLEQIAEGTSVDPNHELETIHEGTSVDPEHELETIHEGDAEEQSHELETIHEGDVEPDEHQLETIHEGTSIDPNHELETIHEGDPEEQNHELETVNETQNGIAAQEGVHEDEQILNPENGISSHEGEHQDESIATGDDNIKPNEQSPEDRNIHEGQESITPGDQPYETPEIHDANPIYESDPSELQGETLDVNPDEGGEDDTPIDRVTPIHADEHELTKVKPLDEIYAENAKVGSVDPGQTQMSTNQHNGEVKYTTPPGKVSTVAEWGQVPFVGDVIGLATSAFNNVKDELGAILHDKRYQVYLACQALDMLMTDRVYGTGMMSPTQAIQYVNMLKNQWTSQLGSKAIALIKNLLLGGGVDKSIGKFHIDDNVTGSPKRGLPTDALDGKAGKYTLGMLPNPYEDAILINPDDPSHKTTRSVQSKTSGMDMSAFLNEYEKVIYGKQLGINRHHSKSQDTQAPEEKELKYWDDDGKTYDAPLKGYKTIAGFSLDSSHLWDISFKRYTEEGAIPCYVPPPPSVGVNQKDEAGWVPALSYDFDDFRVESKSTESPLGYEGFKFPQSRNKPMTFSMQILDNQFGQWGEWLRQIGRLTASNADSFVAPYKCLCYEMDLYILDVGSHIRYLRKLIVSLDDPENKYTGEEDPAVVTYNTNWRIVGELSSSKDAQTKKW